jgi:acetylornithine deacetylase
MESGRVGNVQSTVKARDNCLKSKGKKMDYKNDLKSRIDLYIEKNQEAAIGLLRDLLKFRTVVGTSYREIQEYIARRFHDLGFNVDLWEPKLSEYRDIPWFDAPPSYYPNEFKDKPVLVGTWKGPGEKSIIINGHVDVVSPEPVSLWSCDPWEGVVREGRIFGRGVIDTKGGLAAAIMALEGLKKNGFAPAGQIHFISAIDQEINGAGTIAAIKRGYHADVALVVEPTNFDIALATVGAFWFRVSVKGKASHAAAVWEGINAAEKAIFIHQGLKEAMGYRAKLKHPLYENYPIPATFNLGTFTSGGYPSSVPDKARLEYRLGVLPGESNEDVIAELEKAIHEVASRDPWLKEHPPETGTYGWYGDPTEIERDHLFIQILEANYRSIRGKEPSLVGMTYGCDASRFWTLAKIKSVVFAPGDLWAHAHRPDEYLKIDEFIQYIKIIAHSLLDWFDVLA